MTLSGPEYLSRDLEGEPLLLLRLYLLCFGGDKAECSETAERCETLHCSTSAHTETFLQAAAEQPLDSNPRAAQVPPQVVL